MSMEAPTEETSESVYLDVETQLKDIVQNLYNLIVQSYDHRGSPTHEAMKREIQSLIQNLVKLSRTAPAIHVLIPPEIVMYVEGSRNPDIYNREFVETVQRMNQMLKGRSEALQALQAQIAHQLQIAIPEMKGDIERAIEATGGKVPITGTTIDP